jgi:hypothetical protein
LSKPFELKIENSGTLQSAELIWGVDCAARLLVRTGLSAKQRMEFGLGSVPKTLDLKCHGKALFQGALHSVRANGLHGLELEFRDPLDILSRTYESEFLKGQRLEGFLNQVAGIAGLRARFFGKFNQELPGSDLGGPSYLQHLVRLSYEYGFHFVVHSASKELLFISLGAFREKVSAKSTALSALRSSRSVDSLYGAAEVMAFDSSQGKSQKTEMNVSTVYESLGFLKDAASFETKTRWALAGGRRETVAGAGVDPEKFRQTVCAGLAKQAADSETLCVVAHEPLGLPGDQLDLSAAAEKALDGKYLIAKVRTVIASASPSHELTLIRA